MQGVFQHLDLAMRPDGQVLVNLGLIHRDSEWIPYWSGWLDWMRARGWRRFGLYTWDQGPACPATGTAASRLPSSSSSTSTVQARRAEQDRAMQMGRHAEQGQRPSPQMACSPEYQHAGLPVQDFRIPDNVLRLTRHKGRGIETEHPAVFPVVLPGS